MSSSRIQRSKKAELARVDRELAEIAARPDIVAGQAPAWLVTLGVEDWEMERRLIEAESALPFGAALARGPHQENQNCDRD